MGKIFDRKIFSDDAARKAKKPVISPNIGLSGQNGFRRKMRKGGGR